MIKNLVRLSNLNLFYSSLIVMAIFSVAILDVAGLGLFFIFINTFITNSFSSYFENPMIDTLLSLNSSYFLLILSFVYIIKFILSILLQFLISKVALREQYELKAKLLKKLSNLNLYNLINLNNSKLLNILSNHMNIFSNSLESFLRLISDIFFVIVITVFLLFINTEIVLLGIIMMISLLFLIKSMLTKKIEFFGNIYNKSLNNQFIKTKEFLSGMQVIKLFEKENLFSSSIISSAYKVYINSLKRNLFNILPRQIFELVAILFIIFMTGFMLNYFSKDFVISTISVFVISLPRLIPILNSIIINLNTLNFGKPAINEITEIFNLKKDYEDKTHKIIGDFNEIMIEKLKFKFKNKKEYLFKINHLSIKKNEVIGIIGESGSGKTTFINLLIGHNSKFEGSISIDNEKFTKIKRYSLNNVALVPQENFIFQGSVDENITFGDQKTKKNRVKLEKAISSSQLKNFYAKNKNKNLSDMGLNISGGQKQRINIARAFYFDKNFLIFDEPSSSLDDKTEDDFISVLRENKGKFTILIITHRKSILKICDSIYKFENNNLYKSPKID